EAAGKLIEVLASARRSEWMLAGLAVDGPACRAMVAALSRRGLPWNLMNRFQRAVLETGTTFDGHMARHVSARRRSDLARNRRRLEKLGEVRYASHREGEAL